MNILIAPDSFKDCMKAMDVAEALSRGIRKIIPHAEIRLLPMADGGEGTVESLMDALGGQIRSVRVKDPLMREISSFYGISGDASTAVIEMASASGLELLDQGERNPWITSTFGTGELILDALDQGCRKILLGIGGSATNDGGKGLAEALGVKFLDEQGKALAPGGGALAELVDIQMGALDPRIAECEIMVACDVTNPLTGPEGASFVYGPQKGADKKMVEMLDQNLSHLSRLIFENLGKDVNNIPGAGAAGGLGAGLMAFLGARLVKGFDMVADAVSLEGSIKWADLVITGEGRMDAQTRFGKTPMGVAKMSQACEKPVFGVAGSLEEDAGALYEEGFTLLLPIQEKPINLAGALEQAPLLLERCGERIARILAIRL